MELYGTEEWGFDSDSLLVKTKTNNSYLLTITLRNISYPLTQVFPLQNVTWRIHKGKNHSRRMEKSVIWNQVTCLHECTLQRWILPWTSSLPALSTAFTNTPLAHLFDFKLQVTVFSPVEPFDTTTFHLFFFHKGKSYCIYHAILLFDAIKKSSQCSLTWMLSNRIYRQSSLKHV